MTYSSRVVTWSTHAHGTIAVRRSWRLQFRLSPCVLYSFAGASIDIDNRGDSPKYFWIFSGHIVIGHTIIGQIDSIMPTWGTCTAMNAWSNIFIVQKNSIIAWALATAIPGFQSNIQQARGLMYKSKIEHQGQRNDESMQKKRLVFRPWPLYIFIGLLGFWRLGQKNRFVILDRNWL